VVDGVGSVCGDGEVCVCVCVCVHMCNGVVVVVVGGGGDSHSCFSPIHVFPKNCAPSLENMLSLSPTHASACRERGHRREWEHCIKVTHIESEHMHLWKPFIDWTTSS
jgi:hypothetical protein